MLRLPWARRLDLATVGPGRRAKEPSLAVYIAGRFTFPGPVPPREPGEGLGRMVEACAPHAREPLTSWVRTCWPRHRGASRR